MIFGTDGIRDIGAQGLLSAESLDRIGLALCEHLRRIESSTQKILIAMDTRVSGPEIESLITATLHREGVSTIHAGVIPTPAVSVLLAGGVADLGLMISASHNPPEFNGIKVLDNKGEKLSVETEAQISKDYDRLQSWGVCYSRLKNGNHSIEDQKIDETLGQTYLNSLLSSFPEGEFLAGTKVVVDAARGAACHWAEEAFRRAGAEVFLIHGDPDGELINVGCGSLNPKVLSEEVVNRKADLGIALDGDADRALFCDHNGGLLDGDDVMAIWALHLKQQGKLEPPVVALTVMSNMGVEKFFNEHGIEVLRTPVGDREIAIALKNSGGQLGGETSGHIIHRSMAATGDGIRTGLSVALCLKESGRTLSELRGQFDRFPLKQRTIKIEYRPDFESLAILGATMTEAEKALGQQGRIVVRYSGTEPLLRILVEAESEELSQHWIERLLQSARSEASLGTLTEVL
ncbi:MAG: phosphoglucosamine mutase [Planctomycetia bacterium]|nr:phosphoglucosamine mutase [Planctomycetia bacterium]MBL6915281.1 phosphoglucosamine mutase [Planctomycetota bacterium]HCW44810.1 phosphoglucosamine mutase [Planctomycetota bacterium]